MKNLIYIIMLLFCCSQVSLAEEWKRVVDLRGYWSFTIGDNPEWSKPEFNDSNWETIRVPSSWENDGFHGYNGFAWYRITFNINRENKNDNLYLSLGRIDDADEVYLNGHLIGFSGKFPPEFETAYSVYRNYPIPNKFLNFDRPNVVSIRVYDSILEGGIVEGKPGVYQIGEAIPSFINLAGTWKFSVGDNFEMSNPEYDASYEEDIIVPGYWEAQIGGEYDGYAWYRTSFDLTPGDKNNKYVLVLGKIDDIDQAFINGKLVGSTGNLEEIDGNKNLGSEYQEFRGYYLQNEDLNFNGENVVAVRVFDGYKNGGIYEGPVGIVTQSEYRKYWQKKSRKKSIWELLFSDY